MSWQYVSVAYRLLSPLHVGYHKVGNVQRTRYYLPARNLWAAVTERLTRAGFRAPGVAQGSYQDIGNWVKDHLAFTYFFVHDGENWLFPHYDAQGLCYGCWSQAEFERRYLSSHVTTALDASTTSAEAGSLHEVEFIAPHDQDGKPVFLAGYIFWDDEARERLGDAPWRSWLGELHVGGERRYGFGRLRMVEEPKTQEAPSGYTFITAGERPIIRADARQPLLAHTLAHNVPASGMIEPLVGRETCTEDSQSFGRTLTKAQICWVPGSILQKATSFILHESGIWQPA